MALLAVSCPLVTAPQSPTNTLSNQVLLLDVLGQTVKVPTNALPESLLPPGPDGLRRQLPDLLAGANPPVEVRARHAAAFADLREFEFFPAVAPLLMPYLAGVDESGNTALKPGPLLPSSALDQFAQQPKYWLSDHGLRYSLAQNLTFLTMSEVMQGDHSQGFYVLDWNARWNVFTARAAGTAGWVATQIEVKSGLGSNGASQEPKSSLGSITSPNYDWSSVNGIRVPELAWQQSLSDGRIVVVAGMVSQRNYIDGNAYAHSAHSQFLNSALVHSQVLPLAQYNFGVNLQWQPREEWYAMLGASAGNANAGELPWTDFSWNTWSLLGEFGYAPRDLLGLGPGVYRIQPFVAQAGGPTQGGLAVNVQQKLGEHSPLGWFGRFGFGGDAVAAGASTQMGTGLVAKGPLAHLGLFPDREFDYAGLGFIWSQPSATTKTVVHANEFAIEMSYVLQLTPTIKVQPDLQVVWNPAFNTVGDRSVVFQLQLDILW